MKRIVIAASALTIAGSAVAFGTSALASADTTTNTGHPRMGQHRHEEGRERMDARLNQAVRDGTITEAQKTAFLSELKTLHDQHKTDVSKNSSKDDRKAERDTLHTELKAWATANNFPLDKIAPKHAE